MVDAIISALVEDLTSMLLSSIKEEVKLVNGVNDEVRKLVSNLKSIQAVLDDAEEQQLKEASVKKWLFNLKAISYDMDDVIDDWKTWIQTSQFQNQHYSSGSNQSQPKHKVLSIFYCSCFIKRDVGLRHVVARKIRVFQQRLDDIATDKVRHQLSSSQKTKKHIERHVTTSFVDIEKVKGRDEEKDEVKRKVLEAKSNPQIISLVGLGGIGKTTLAQLVYNDSEIKTHFHKKIWVCVSKPFDEIQIAKAILESLYGSSALDFKELDLIFYEISVFLNEKRFLLVLDDVWNENPKEWEELEKIFNCGLRGTTIMITTRNERVAIAMGCNPESIHKLGILTSEQCWSIISEIALVQGDSQKFESIGRRLADKCKGLPLAAITIGRLLRFKKSEKEWLRVLEKKEWEGEGILGPLKLSYYDLTLPLKQCFSYCAMFPKDSKIEKRTLIRMWMAQGYLKGKEDDEILEIGETYFENLIAHSLFQTQFYNDNNFCKVHDMVMDLAQIIAKNECLMIDVLNDREPNGNILHLDVNARHLFVVIEKNAPFPVSIYGLNKLRTLIIQLVRYKSSLTIVELEGIFDHLTCLRTLGLYTYGIKEIPSSINRLVHLRWLDLSNNRIIEKLPETLCECYNLQTLILNWCKSLVELPEGIGKLINLMYLDIERCDKIKYLPKGIGNLWRLRELTVFIISVNEDKSFSIVEMEKLNNLRGRLMIRGLGNVKKPEEARKAQLKEKKNITELSLSFDRDEVQEDRDDVGEDEEELPKALQPPSDMEILYIDEEETVDEDNGMKDEEELLEALEPPLNTEILYIDEEETVDEDNGMKDEEEVVEALEPPCDLEILSIENCRGKTFFPSWMMKLNLLRKLTIQNSRNGEELPPLGKLSCLEELELKNMRVKRVGVEFMGIEKEKDASMSFVSFPKLKILRFMLCREWEEWDDIDEWLMERINNKTITIMSSLKKLYISYCSKLKTLPYHLLSPHITTSLQRLLISRCDVLKQEVQKDKLSHIPDLKIE